MNKSEEEEYDILFPEHSLSEARALLTKIAVEIEFGNELHKIAKFKK